MKPSLLLRPLSESEQVALNLGLRSLLCFYSTTMSNLTGDRFSCSATVFERTRSLLGNGSAIILIVNSYPLLPLWEWD